MVEIGCGLTGPINESLQGKKVALYRNKMCHFARSPCFIFFMAQLSRMSLNSELKITGTSRMCETINFIDVEKQMDAVKQAVCREF